MGQAAQQLSSSFYQSAIDGSSLMQKRYDDDSKACLTAFVQDKTLIAVIEMSLASWLVAGMIPGVNRDPLKKIAADPELLLRLLYRWRDEAIKAGKEITRIAVAYETGRDGFWLARWLRDRGIDAYVIHATSVLYRANTDGRKRIGSTPRCYDVAFLAGCVVNVATAA
jgi:hypothetical protein